MRIRTITDSSGKRFAVPTLKGRCRGICREEYEQPLELNVGERILGALPPTGSFVGRGIDCTTRMASSGRSIVSRG